jgi:hypothetical protein
MTMDPTDAPSTDALAGSGVHVPDHVVLREFETETVVLDLDTGKYHSVNATGGRFLETLRASATFGDALGRLQQEFGDQSRATLAHDLRAFCLELRARGLLALEER